MILLARLLDMDETGTLSPQELVDGWFRLRGPAKAGESEMSCQKQFQLEATVAHFSETAPESMQYWGKNSDQKTRDDKGQ